VSRRANEGEEDKTAKDVDVDVDVVDVVDVVVVVVDDDDVVVDTADDVAVVVLEVKPKSLVKIFQEKNEFELNSPRHLAKQGTQSPLLFSAHWEHGAHIFSAVQYSSEAQFPLL